MNTIKSNKSIQNETEQYLKEISPHNSGKKQKQYESGKIYQKNIKNKNKITFVEYPFVTNADCTQSKVSTNKRYKKEFNKIRKKRNYQSQIQKLEEKKKNSVKLSRPEKKLNLMLETIKKYWAEPPNTKDISECWYKIPLDKKEEKFQSFLDAYKGKSETIQLPTGQSIRAPTLEGSKYYKYVEPIKNIKGRGMLGNWGPNPAADAVIINPSSKKILLGQRKDGGEWAFLGGMVDPDEHASQTSIREAKEEGNVDLTKITPQTIYSGVVDDPRNTYNAWMVTKANLFLVPPTFGKNMEAGDDIKNVQWFDYDVKDGKINVKKGKQKDKIICKPWKYFK